MDFWRCDALVRWVFAMVFSCVFPGFSWLFPGFFDGVVPVFFLVCSSFSKPGFLRYPVFLAQSHLWTVNLISYKVNCMFLGYFLLERWMRGAMEGGRLGTLWYVFLSLLGGGCDGRCWVSLVGWYLWLVILGPYLRLCFGIIVIFLLNKSGGKTAMLRMPRCLLAATFSICLWVKQPGITVPW